MKTQMIIAADATYPIHETKFQWRTLNDRLGLLGCRSKSVSAGLHSDQGCTPSLSVMLQLQYVACGAKCYALSLAKDTAD